MAGMQSRNLMRAYRSAAIFKPVNARASITEPAAGPFATQHRFAHQDAAPASASSKTDSSASGTDGGKGRETKNGAQPKFNTEPQKTTPEVEKHNEELEKRKNNSSFQGGGKTSETVEKGFWTGQK